MRLGVACSDGARVIHLGDSTGYQERIYRLDGASLRLSATDLFGCQFATNMPCASRGARGRVYPCFMKPWKRSVTTARPHRCNLRHQDSLRPLKSRLHTQH